MISINMWETLACYTEAEKEVEELINEHIRALPVLKLIGSVISFYQHQHTDKLNTDPILNSLYWMPLVNHKLVLT